MSMTIAITSIRILLTLVLLYGAYTETGTWTTTALVLIFVYCELNSILWRRRE